MATQVACNPGCAGAAAMAGSQSQSARVIEPIASLHERFRAPLHRFFARFRLNSHDIEDLTQEVFLRLARPGHCEALRQPDAFLFTLARNLVRDRARRLYTRAAKSSVNLEDLELPCDSPSPEESVENDERLRWATSALEALRLETRRAFIMHRVMGCSYAEIATDMGVSISMIEKHVMSAIAALRAIDPRANGKIKRLGIRSRSRPAHWPSCR